MQLTKITSFALLLILTLIPSCIKKEKYKIKHAKPLTEQSADFSQTQDQIELHIKKFGTKECMDTFGKRGPKMLEGNSGYYPLQLDITNNTNQSVCITKDDIGLKLATPKDAAKKLKFARGVSTLGFLTLAGILGVVTFYAALVGCVLTYYVTSAGTIIATTAVLAVSLVAAIGTITTPFVGITREVQKSELNKSFDTDLKAEGLEHLVVAPGKNQCALIFVQKNDFKEHFILKIHMPENKAIIDFDVDLAPKAIEQI